MVSSNFRVCVGFWIKDTRFFNGQILLCLRMLRVRAVRFFPSFLHLTLTSMPWSGRTQNDFIADSTIPQRSGPHFCFCNLAAAACGHGNHGFALVVFPAPEFNLGGFLSGSRTRGVLDVIVKDCPDVADHGRQGGTWLQFRCLGR